MSDQGSGYSGSTTVAPLRQAIKDFDVDALAWASTKAALSHVAWFGAQEPKSVKSSSDLDRRSPWRVGGCRRQRSVTAGTRQLATVTYRYGLSPDFTQIRIIADVTLWQPSVQSCRSRSCGPPVLPEGCRIADVT
eukprot:gene58536-80147_t